MKKSIARFLTVSLGLALSLLGCQSPIVNVSSASQARAITNPPITNFITRSGDKLIENGQVFRFQSINVPNLHIVEDSDWKRFNSNKNDWRRLTEFETRDAFSTLVQIGARVTRTYTFPIKGGTNNGNGLSYYYGPNNYDENLFKDFDRTLALANEYGVYLIIPFIDEWDWVGGRKQFAALNGGGDFYTNGQVKQAFKDWITYILNRTNTITGVKYKDDKAILAWETGNELQSVPASWTAEIAAHVKSVDTNHLMMDGANGSYDASLTNPNIDIVTDHFYSHNGNNYVQRAQSNVARTKGKKVFILGEYGLTDFGTIKATMDYIQSEPSLAGGLLWSLRFHTDAGGFLWHDDQGQMAYHYPGFSTNSVSNERQVWTALRTASFQIRGFSEPARDVPAPAPVLLPQGNNVFAWKGSVGAETYTIQRAENASGPWTTVASNLIDADRPFKPWTDTTAQAGKTYVYRIQAVNASGANPDWSNQNNAPVVQMPADIATSVATVSIPATVSDDGKPSGGTLSVSWSKISGPGTVTFSNPVAASTSATFSTKGDYVLQLTASDSVLSTSARIAVSYGSIPSIKKYEAEAAVYSAVSLVSDGSASGGAFLQFRDTGSVEWTVHAATAGVAELAFGYRAPFGGKEQLLSVNGVSQPNVAFAQSAGWAIVKVSAPLNAGTNKVLMTRSWGWMDLDYLQVTTKETPLSPPTVNFVLPSVVFPLNTPLTISAFAADSDGTIAKVEFFVDGTLRQTVTTAPYDFSWVTPSIVSSPVLKVVATDNDGLTGESSLRVQVGTPPVPPTVSLTSPSAGQAFPLGSNVSIAANASDTDGSVVRVDFFANDVLIGSDTSAPYTWTWPCGTTPGSVSLKAVATDNDGLIAASVVAVQVGTPPPVVTLTNPANSSVLLLGSLVAISATATSSASTISKVDFYVDGVLHSSASAGTPFTSSWTASVLGIHEIKAVATDAFGVSASSSVTVNVVTTGGLQVSVVYTKNDWGSGFTANLVLKNTGSVAVDGWVLRFTFPGNQIITNNWSGTFEQVGKKVTVRNVDYNRVIAPGASINLGFNATYSGTNVDPTDFVVSSN